MPFDTKQTRKAFARLKESGLFSEKELEEAKFWIHEYALNPYILPGVMIVGFSPMKAGEILGLNGKSLQAKCKTGHVVAIRDFQGWWTIPVEEIIHLREEQNEKAN